MYDPSALLRRCNVVCKKLLVNHLSESHAENTGKYSSHHLAETRMKSSLVRFMVGTTTKRLIRDRIRHQNDCDLDLMLSLFAQMDSSRILAVVGVIRYRDMGKLSQSE